MSNNYPVFLKIEDKLCIVVGGGTVGERKVLSLLDCNARVKIISPVLTTKLQELVESGLVEYKQGEYEHKDLDGAFLVISATDNKDTNESISNECSRRGILVNVVDAPSQANFFVPSSLRRGQLTIAISTGGKSPLVSRLIREDLESEYNNDFGSFLDYVGNLREKIIANVDNDEVRKRILHNLVDKETIRLLKKGYLEQAKERVNNVCINYRA